MEACGSNVQNWLRGMNMRAFKEMHAEEKDRMGNGNEWQEVLSFD